MNRERIAPAIELAPARAGFDARRFVGCGARLENDKLPAEGV